MTRERFLGISGYCPRHVEAIGDLTADDRAQLRGLRGRRLVRSWAVWDAGDDEWFVDGPIVLDFGATRLELAAFKTHLCLSWDSIDVSDAIEWSPGSEFRLEWRLDALPLVDAVLDAEVRDVLLADERAGFNSIAFATARESVEIFNALDELGLRRAPDDDPGVVRVRP